MLNALRLTRKRSIQRFHVYALLLIALFCFIFTGCSGLVTANNGSGSPTTLAISGVQATAPTTSGFQVSWSTNLAANSIVDYGITASYGSSTPTNNTMFTRHQVPVPAFAAGKLYHFRVRSTDASNSNATSPDMTLTTTAGGDTTPPTVSITAPTNGATVSGSISITANASDNVGVASVQFQLDGANLGVLDTASPYSVSWNISTASNGSHQLKAIAMDATGDSTTSTMLTLTVSHTTDKLAPRVPALP